MSQLPIAPRHIRLLLDSYRHWLKRDLIPRSGDDLADAIQLHAAPFIVVSHGTQADPILNYGNQAALDLWGLEFAQFTQLPSRYTAEPMHRDERARLLERTSRCGYVDDYRGIRITHSGKRFLIEQAMVWNLIDEEGAPYGQAATFSQYHFLPE